jgi:hypothetical protein
MDISPYIPMSLTIVCLVMSLLTLVFVDEPNLIGGKGANTELAQETSGQRPECLNSAIVDETSAHTTEQNNSLRSLLRKKTVLVTLFLFIVPAFRPITTHVLLQYMSVRFQWALSSSTVLISEIAVINIVLFLFILPKSVLWIKTHFKTPEDMIDLGVVRGSLFLLAVGSLLIGWAPSPNFVIPGMSSISFS